MIAYLRGALRDIQTNNIILDVNGVGYLVYVPASVSEALASSDGEQVELHIATIVREDAITLYGFSEPTDREAFDILKQVKGVGPKVALAILGTLGLPATVAAIRQEQPAVLVKVSGVGKRLADRLCLELKDKMPVHFQAESMTTGSTTARFVPPQDPLPLALAQLGYRKSEIDLVLSSADVPKIDDAAIEVRLSAALRVLQRQ
ncbi:MAG: Holliday junction DNA helicase RuvA [Myxococcota bacterium]|jgi:Holliday junction DNA helicase RuvA